jgi:uncharacterized repeat protein (TIGR03803 family)
MGKYLIAIATVIVFFQGGSGTPQQPFGNLQAIQSHRALLGGPPTHYKILYSFQGGADGASPYGDLVTDGAGNIYGTTDSGGSQICNLGCGTVFKLDSNGKETVLFRFDGTDGEYPQDSIVRDPTGTLYGLAGAGGNPSCQYGCGIIFKLTRGTGGTWTETALHSFSGPDGSAPSGFVRDAAGNSYGTTFSGGGQPGCSRFGGCGLAFRLDLYGNETVLHFFTNHVGGPIHAPYGTWPEGGLVRDPAGNLYGTTSQGGYLDSGVVFKMDPSGNEIVLHRFNGADGAQPYSVGCGVVFKIDPNGNETVLHYFDGTDGSLPYSGLIRDAAGNLYGTTFNGGPSNDGMVFELDPRGNETILHSFNGVDGASCVGNLIRDDAGNIYGTASNGGSTASGVVFELTH